MKDKTIEILISCVCACHPLIPQNIFGISPSVRWDKCPLIGGGQEMRDQFETGEKVLIKTKRGQRALSSNSAEQLENYKESGPRDWSPGVCLLHSLSANE